MRIFLLHTKPPAGRNSVVFLSPIHSHNLWEVYQTDVRIMRFIVQAHVPLTAVTVNAVIACRYRARGRGRGIHAAELFVRRVPPPPMHTKCPRACRARAKPATYHTATDPGLWTSNETISITIVRQRSFVKKKVYTMYLSE